MSGRGGGWVVGQFVLMACVVAAGFLPPEWPDGARGVLRVAGAVLAVVGVAFAVWAGRVLGRSLTPFPRPVAAGLVTTGPFRLVRHPIYTGGLGLFLGYALFTSVAALVLTLALAVLWAAKLRVEERLLAEVYDGYAAYQRRVRWRLVPLVY
jgi:protein-S-isoprenylcysteine O-methyltransferase Ste14